MGIKSERGWWYVDAGKRQYDGSESASESRGGKPPSPPVCVMVSNASTVNDILAARDCGIL